MFGELKRVLKHSMIYGAGSVINKAVGFIMIPVYTHYLTPKDYGIIELLTLSNFLISIFLGAGLASAIFKFYYSYEREEERQQVISTALIFIILVSLSGVLLLSCGTTHISSILFKTPQYSSFFQIIFINMFFEMSCAIALIYLRIKEMSVWYMIISISQMLLGLSLNIYLIVFLKLGILGILYSMVIVSGTSFFILIPFIFKGVGFSFSREKLKEMVIFGAPLALSTLGSFVLNFIDRFFLNHFSLLRAVGLYSLGAKFGSMISILLGQPFTLIWIPFMFDTANKPKAKEIYSKVLTYFSFVMIFAWLGLSVLSKEIVKIIAAPSFFEAYKVIPLIAASYIFFEVEGIVRVGIFLEKKTKWMPVIVWTSGIFNILLNLLLVPRYNILGAGWSKLLGYFLFVVFIYSVSQRFYSISYEFNRILKMIIVGFLIYLMSFLIRPESILLAILLKLGLVLSFPFLLYLLKFYQSEELQKLGEICFRLRQVRQVGSNER